MKDNIVLDKRVSIYVKLKVVDEVITPDVAKINERCSVYTSNSNNFILNLTTIEIFRLEKLSESYGQSQSLYKKSLKCTKKTYTARDIPQILLF